MELVGQILCPRLAWLYLTGGKLWSFYMGCLSRDIVRAATTLFLNLIVIKCNITKVLSRHTKSILILIVHPGWDLLGGSIWNMSS